MVSTASIEEQFEKKETRTRPSRKLFPQKRQKKKKKEEHKWRKGKKEALK